MPIDACWRVVSAPLFKASECTGRTKPATAARTFTRSTIGAELFQCAQVGNHLTDLLHRQFFSEGCHLAFLALPNAHRNLFIVPVQVMQVRTFVASRVGAMAMRAIFQKQRASGGHLGGLCRRTIVRLSQSAGNESKSRGHREREQRKWF